MVVTHLVIIMLDQDLVGQTEMVQPEVLTVGMVVDLIAMVAGIIIVLVSLVLVLKMVAMVVTDNMVESAALVAVPADMVEPAVPADTLAVVAEPGAKAVPAEVLDPIMVEPIKVIQPDITPAMAKL